MNPFERVFVNALKGYWNRGVVRYLTRRLPAVPGGRILELGCGRGSILRLVLEEFQPTVYLATDLDSGQLRRARRGVEGTWGAAPRGLTLALADAHRLPFRGSSFDVILLFAVLHHVEDWRRVLDECFRVLAPNGRIIVEEYLHKRAIREYLRARATVVLDKGLARTVCVLVADRQSEAPSGPGLPLPGIGIYAKPK